MDPIEELLSRSVANIIPGKDKLSELLHTDKKLNIYLGIDPTSVHIHLGHAVPLRKLQKFVDLGHHVTFLIGDFTALIGDTSDKDTERPVLTKEQIEANFQTYKAQASKLLDFSQVVIRHNSEWLGKLNFEEIIKLSRHFSLNDFISRELIKKRLSEGKSVSLPETLYPVMQGYDSWYIDTDLQIGGTDQTFNMQAGRTLQKILRNKESFVLSNDFLEGTDGRKMSKSWGNAIWLDDSPKDIYGKVMSLKDELIDQYFLLATNLSQSEFPDSKSNPLVAKKMLARQITEELHGPETSKAAETNFESTVQNRELPVELPEIPLPTPANVINVLVSTGLAKSNSDARRLIDQRGVKVDNQTITDFEFIVSSKSILSVGSRKFVKIV